MLRSNKVRIALVVLGFAVAGWYCTAAEEKDAPIEGAANARARLDAATKVYEGSWKFHVQSPQSATGLDYWHDWSVRWMQAEQDLGGTKADRIAAVKRHLDRMRIWRERVEKAVKEGNEPIFAATAAEFFVLEAEDWLAAAKTEGN
jgi:hypothetical protein